MTAVPSSISGRTPGGAPRNGLPPSGGYTYRGTGREMAPSEIIAHLRRKITARQQQPAAPSRLEQLEAGLAARGVITPDRPVPYWPAYYPGPGVPGRCPACGYMLTAAGHKIACGSEP